MASAAKSSVLTYKDLGVFCPPGTPVVMTPDKESVVIGRHMEDIWFNATNSKNEALHVRVECLSPILRKGNFVLFASKNGQYSYKIAKVISVSQDGTARLRLLSEQVDAVVKVSLLRTIPCNRSQSELVFRLTGSSLPEDQQVPSLDLKEERVRCDRKDYTYKVGPNGEIQWDGFGENEFDPTQFRYKDGQVVYDGFNEEIIGDTKASQSDPDSEEEQSVGGPGKRGSVAEQMEELEWRRKRQRSSAGK
jgi:hypothetical protein